MKKIAALLFIVIFISGCATLDYLFTDQTQQAKSIWPAPSRYKMYWYRPKMLSSSEEAMGILKNLQQSFVEFTAGRHFKTFDLDKYGLRTKWEWTEATQSTEYVPSSGGGFIGWNYVSYYGGSYQPRTYTSQHEGAFVIPFAVVSSLEIGYCFDVPGTWKWDLVVYLDNKNPIELRAPDEETVKQLGNAIATLSREQGRIIRFPMFGFRITPLTPEQSAELALHSGTGLLIHDVYVGSPAEKANLRFLDVILEVDGQPVKDDKELITLSENKKSVNLKILRREKITDAAGNASLQKTELSLPINFDK